MGPSFVGNMANNNPPTGHVHKRHNDGFVAIFVDGHTKWMRNTKLGQWTCRSGD